MSYRVYASIDLRSSGDPTTPYSSFPQLHAEASWEAEQGIQSGDMDASSGTTLRLPHPAFGARFDARRRLLALHVNGATVKLNVDQNWEGGTPLDVLDLASYAVPPTARDAAAATKLVPLAVFTNRLVTGLVIVASPASGHWYYIEGESAAERGVWDPE